MPHKLGFATMFSVSNNTEPTTINADNEMKIALDKLKKEMEMRLFNSMPMDYEPNIPIQQGKWYNNCKRK